MYLIQVIWGKAFWEDGTRSLLLFLMGFRPVNLGGLNILGLTIPLTIQNM